MAQTTSSAKMQGIEASAKAFEDYSTEVKNFMPVLDRIGHQIDRSSRLTSFWVDCNGYRLDVAYDDNNKVYTVNGKSYPYNKKRRDYTYLVSQVIMPAMCEQYSLDLDEVVDAYGQRMIEVTQGIEKAIKKYGWDMD